MSAIHAKQEVKEIRNASRQIHCCCAIVPRAPSNQCVPWAFWVAFEDSTCACQKNIKKKLVIELFGQKLISSWWLAPPLEKYYIVKLDHFPKKNRGEKKNVCIYIYIFELPPARYLECFELNLDLYVMMDALAAQHMTQSFNALALPRTHKFGTQKLSSKEKVHSSSPNFETHPVYADISPYIYIYNYTYVFSILNLGQDFKSSQVSTSSNLGLTKTSPEGSPRVEIGPMGSMLSSKQEIHLQISKGCLNYMLHLSGQASRCYGPKDTQKT